MPVKKKLIDLFTLLQHKISQIKITQHLSYQLASPCLVPLLLNKRLIQCNCNFGCTHSYLLHISHIQVYHCLISLLRLDVQNTSLYIYCNLIRFYEHETRIFLKIHFSYNWQTNLYYQRYFAFSFWKWAYWLFNLATDTYFMVYIHACRY